MTSLFSFDDTSVFFSKDSLERCFKASILQHGIVSLTIPVNL